MRRQGVETDQEEEGTLSFPSFSSSSFPSYGSPPPPLLSFRPVLTREEHSYPQVKRELRVLSNLRGGTNIIELLDVVRDPQSKTPTIVTEHVENVESKTLYPKFTDGDVVSRRRRFLFVGLSPFCTGETDE